MDNETGTARRKKRIKRLKKMIVAVACIFLLLPTILCIILFARVGKLSSQIDRLSELTESIPAWEEQDTDDTGNTGSTDGTEPPPGSAAPDTATESEGAAADGTKNASGEDAVPENLTDGEAGLAEVSAAEQKEKQTDDKADTRKKVYLTFDDGPSEHTYEILDILDEFEVKATFFVTGKSDQASKERYMEIVERGHTIGMHSYSHNYTELYQSLGNFKKDYKKIRDLIQETTGVTPVCYRFPGGSSTSYTNQMQTYINYLTKQGVEYYDWNVASGDAVSKILTEKELLRNVTNGIKPFQTSVVLLHDLAEKTTTVSFLPQLLKKLQAEDIEILPITEETKPVHHRLPAVD